MDVIEKFLHRISYKFPKGYPDMNIPQDVTLLENELSKLNIHLNEETDKPSIDYKKQLKDLIDNIDIPDALLQKLIKNISGLNSRGEIQSHLSKKGFTPEKFKTGEASIDYIIDRLTSTETQELINYLKHPLNFNKDDVKGNFVQQTKLSPQLVDDLINIEPGFDATGSAIGKAEIFLALVFNNINNKSGGGDLSLDGKNLEVKGMGGRLGSQPGRGSNMNYPEILATKFLQGDEAQQFIDDPKNIDINYALKNIFDIGVKNGQQPQNIINFIQKLMDQIYFNKGIAKEYFNSPDDFKDLAKLKKNILKLNLKSYTKKIHTDYILFINIKTKDYVLVDVDDIDKIVDDGLIDTITKSDVKGYQWHNPNPSIVIK